MIALFSVLGALSILAGLFFFGRLLRHQRFPTAGGTLLNKRIERVRSADSGSDGGGWQYYVIVSYTYEVAGQTYTSDRLFDLCVMGFATAWGATRRTARLEPGRPIRVFYDPARPEHAFLLPGPWLPIWLPILVGGSFVGTAWLIWHRG